MESLSNEITTKYETTKEIRHGYSGSVRIIPELINVSSSSFSLSLIFYYFSGRSSLNYTTIGRY